MHQLRNSRLPSEWETAGVLCAAAKHCAFYPGSYPLKAHQVELKNYDNNKGTIRFPVDSPLPAALVRKLVKSRIAEHAARKRQRTVPAATELRCQQIEVESGKDD